jgi:hypothetical protein
MNIYSPSTTRSSILPVSGSRFGGIFETRSSNIAGNMNDYEKCGGQIAGQISKHRSEWGKCAS